MPWISQWETVLMMNATKTPLYPSYPRLWSVTNPQPSFYNVALILYLEIGWVALMSLLKVSLNYFSKNLVKLLQFSRSLWQFHMICKLLRVPKVSRRFSNVALILYLEMGCFNGVTVKGNFIMLFLFRKLRETVRCTKIHLWN